MPMNLSDIAISKIHGVYCRCLITGISKIEVVNLLQKTDLNKNSRTLWNIKSLFSNKKMGKKALTFLYVEFQKHKFCRYKNHFKKDT